MSSPAPPLWTWPVAIVLAAAALLAAQLASSRALAQHETARMNLARVQAHRSVVVLGNSKIRCGVLFDPQMSAALAQRGAPAPVVRISAPAAEIEDFDLAFDALQRTPPRLLLVESDYVALEPAFYRHSGEAEHPDWRKQVRMGLKLARKPDPRAYGTVGDFNANPAPCSLHDAKPRSPQAYASDLQGRRTSTAFERRRLLARLRRLQAAGTQVVLLETPRSPAYATAFPSAVAQAIPGILRRSAAENHLGLFVEPPNLAAGDFLDAAHLNADGRALYSAWLADQIAAQLKRGAAA